MSDITILGSGRVAGILAKGLTGSNHTIRIGRREADAPRPEWAPADLEIMPTHDAIIAGDIIINATPGETSAAFLSPYASALEGKILMDVSNGLQRDQKGIPVGLAYPDSSVAEELQAALPDTRVVKTLNTMLFPVMSNPGLLSRPASVFVSGDDDAAKQAVKLLLETLGWNAAAIEDLGGVETARGPESFMHFVPALMKRDGMVPFALAIAR